MKYPELNAIKKPLINLSGTGGLGVIIQLNSGLVYTNQTGGVNCLYPTIEGCYLPIVDEYIDQEKMLIDYFTGPKHQGFCFDGIDEKDAIEIDRILALSFISKIFKVDRANLKNSHEAWIYVEIGSHPERFPKLPAEWTPDMGSVIYGINGKKGILTWENSD
ncbi:DUF6210 family protein [Pleionea sediminis]|uniref:DUF6210 family protein n=1 Tax=Pleionea sediminis TaxID=2569479 RepID=UPI001185AAFF|nr:DUF6210 family protein [Pleionea sediminis]